MADTDPVRIVVEIVDNFTDELQELRAQLEEIDMQRIDPDFDLDDDGDIEQVRAQIRALMAELEAMEAELDVGVDESDVAEVEVTKEILSSDMTSTLNIETDVNRGFLNRARMRGISQLGTEAIGGEAGIAPSLPDQMFDSDLRSQTRNMRSLRRAAETLQEVDVDVSMPGDDDQSIFARLAEHADHAEDEMKGLMKNLRQHLPSMNTWYNLVAVFVPVLATLGVAAAGVATAFAAVGAAAAGIVGIGLLGWGKNLQESFQNLQREAQLLGQRLFEVLQPAADAFQPILQDWMAGAPQQVSRIVDELKQLTAFAPTLEEIGVGFVSWLENGIEAMLALRRQISQLSLRFGDLLGGAIINLLQGLVREAYRNQDAYIQLGIVLRDVALAIFDLFKTISFAVAKFQPLISLVQDFVSLLGNELTMTVVFTVMSLFALEAALSAVLGVMGLLAGSQGVAALVGAIASRFLPTITAVTIATWEWVAALSALQKALLATGIGALAVGGGILLSQTVFDERRRGRRGSRSRQTNITINGDVGRREYERIIDRMPREARGEIKTQEAMEQ